MQKMTNKNIVLAENRHLDILASLLERHNANVIRCPMFSILDTPDKEPVYRWIERFIGNPFNLFIILTGEGLNRLVHSADEKNLKTEFIHALEKSKKLIRGPKPRKALSMVNLKPDLIAEQPTTDGVISTLSELDLAGNDIGVQLYGSEPNKKLIDFIKSKKAEAFPVSPYIYASETDDEEVKKVIRNIVEGSVDMIVFTSEEQYKRLKKVADASVGIEKFFRALNSTAVASIGPVVSKILNSDGVKVSVTPKSSYFIKPLVNEIVEFFNQ